jgi:hypothetical protein
MFLKDLKARGYSMSYQGDNFVCCNKTVAPENMTTEWDAVKLISERSFQKQG